MQAQGVSVKQVSTNILQVVSLYSDDDRYDETYLSNYAMINLQYPLARLPGVGQVKVIGAGSYSMRVWLDPNKLQYYQLTTMDVVNAIQQQNVQVVAGQARGAAGARRAGLSVHHQRPGQALGRQAVRGDHYQDGAAARLRPPRSSG